MQRLARRKCVVVLNSHRPRLDSPEAIAAIKTRFAGMAGIRWSLCPDILLLALIRGRPPG